MRLIDADALSDKLCETTIFIKDGSAFQRMINDAPTVSAETHDKRTETHGVCSDLISRADAIHILACEMYAEAQAEGYDTTLDDYIPEAKAWMSDAPSATCDDCIWHVCNYNKIDWDGEDGYISRQDAICEVLVNDGMDNIVDRIKALPSAEAVQGWIPVSERLPEKDELVLVTVWNDVATAWRNLYGGWESAEYMYEKGDVTAWMPLPEPYRKDGE